MTLAAPTVGSPTEEGPERRVAPAVPRVKRRALPSCRYSGPDGKSERRGAWLGRQTPIDTAGLLDLPTHQDTGSRPVYMSTYRLFLRHATTTPQNTSGDGPRFEISDQERFEPTPSFETRSSGSPSLWQITESREHSVNGPNFWSESETKA